MFKQFFSKKQLSLFLIIQILIIQVLAKYPKQITAYYSNGIYPIISKFERALFGWIGISIGDIFYGILVFIIIRFFYKRIKTKTLFKTDTLWHIGALLSIVYLLFYFLWGLNYYREPLYKTLALDKEKVSKEELIRFSTNLIKNINIIQESITHNDSLPVPTPYTFETIFNKSSLGYQVIASDFDGISLRHKSLKKSLFSYPQILMGFTGYLNPFTAEAQVNYLIPKVNLPATTCHEMAHQMGYASETEANFIGFMAALNNDNIYFKFSAYYMALNYTLNEIHANYPDEFEAVYAKLNYGIKENQRLVSEHYQKYQNKLPFSLHSKDLYNAYLKINHQKQGINSYKYMIYLLIKYNQKVAWMSSY